MRNHLQRLAKTGSIGETPLIVNSYITFRGGFGQSENPGVGGSIPPLPILTKQDGFPIQSGTLLAFPPAPIAPPASGRASALRALAQLTHHFAAVALILPRRNARLQKTEIARNRTRMAHAQRTHHFAAVALILPRRNARLKRKQKSQ